MFMSVKEMAFIFTRKLVGQIKLILDTVYIKCKPSFFLLYFIQMCNLFAVTSFTYQYCVEGTNQGS